MRFFQVCADPGIAPDGTKGASVHLRCLARALRQRGHDVTTFTARPPREQSGDWRPLTGASGIAEAARTDGADVIYERYSLGHRNGLDAARAAGRPFVLEVNAPLVDEARRHRPGTVTAGHADVERLLLREADLVVAVSRPLADLVTAAGRRRPTVVVPNGCDLPPEAAPVATAPPVVAFLGHPKPWHGADRLPQLVGELVNRGHDARLLLVGGGPGAELVAEQAHGLGVGDRLTITGEVGHEDAVALLAGAAVGVAPYPPQDPFYFSPIKVVEYMAAGLPVVATAQGDIPELLGDGGVCVTAGDEAGFVDAVDRLLADPQRRAGLGLNGRRRAAARTWDAAAAAVVEGVPR